MKVFLKAAPAATLIALALMIAPGASAAEFCRTDVTGHMTSCGFDTMAQCKAASAGIGGDCFRDPFLKDNRNAYASQPKSSRSSSHSLTVGKAADTH